jgi:hypothetical protein
MTPPGNLTNWNGAAYDYDSMGRLTDVAASGEADTHIDYPHSGRSGRRSGRGPDGGRSGRAAPGGSPERVYEIDCSEVAEYSIV